MSSDTVFEIMEVILGNDYLAVFVADNFSVEEPTPDEEPGPWRYSVTLYHEGRRTLVRHYWTEAEALSALATLDLDSPLGIAAA